MKLRLIICLSLLVLFISPAFANNGIFTDAVYSEAAKYLNTAEPDMDSKVIRSRIVRVDFGMFSSSEGIARTKAGDNLLHFNLFEDAFFLARQEKVIRNKSGSTSWVGKIVDSDRGRVILTFKDNIMVGSVSNGNENYVIRYVGGDIHEIQQMDHSKFAGCEEPETSNPIPNDDHNHDLDRPMADDGSVIDIMVVYNAEARSAAGGTTAMENLIDQAVAESNTGYGQSQVNTSLNLVHTMEVSYSESGFNWSTCLNRLAGKTDGYMDEVHPARDAYNADMVQMVVNNQAYCGLAYTIMASESQAFSLASRVCITGYYSFAHEFGHLQGARHDRYVDNTDYSPYTYNHGWTNPPNNWRTIMAYNNACSAYGGCTRLNYWSNPNITYGGDPMGDPGGAGVGADNHRCLNNTAYTVANFRQSAPALPPVADFSGNPTTVLEGGSVAFTDLSTNNPTSWSWTFTGGTPSTSTAQNPTVTYNTAGTYTVELTATNAAGSDVETKVAYITVNTPPAPVADFSASSTTINEGDSVTFTDLSTNNPTSWSWSFPGGTPSTSTAQNPVVQYNTAGTYDVTLTATNSGGSDIETKVSYITVNVPPATPDIYVFDITQVVSRQGANYFSDATITIKDTDGGLAANANVSISWSGVVSGTDSGTTAANGTVTFRSANAKKQTGPFTITVTNVTHATMDYNPALNVETFDTAYY